MRGGWFIDCINGLLRANDGLCYVSNDEGAKVIVVEVLESMKWENKEEFRYGGENEVTSIMIKVRKKISATNFCHFPSHFRADDGVI